MGWVTAGGGFLQLTQTGAPLADAVQQADSRPRELARTETVDGTEVQVYTSDAADVRDLWALDAGDARFLVTGAGTDEEFHTLISAALKATPITPQD